jgi:hypothetical protein
VENLKKTIKFGASRASFYAAAFRRGARGRSSATYDIVIWARFGRGICLAFSVRAPSPPTSAPAPASPCAPSGGQAAAHSPATNPGPPPRLVSSSAGATAPTVGATQVPPEPAPGGSSAVPGSDVAAQPRAVGASGSSMFQQLQ